MARRLATLLLLLLPAACASAPARLSTAPSSNSTPADPPTSLDVSLPAKFPACAAEIKAFVALSRIANQMGEAAPVLAPQLDAMQEQVMDCLEESYPDPLPI